MKNKRIIADYVESTINRFPRGYVFTYTDFEVGVNEQEATIKALNRLAAAGKINKLSKGRFYKAETTAFGTVMPEQKQIVKDLLEENGKVVGYLTGYSIYNKLGLTTQVSNTIQIGKNQIRSRFKRERYTISFIKQKNTINKENIPLLQILDSIRYVKKIPDSTIEASCKRFLIILKGLSDQELNAMVRLSLKYPPSTRALLGAMLEHLNKEEIAQDLFKTLNPITKYNITGASKAIPTAAKWNIL